MNNLNLASLLISLANSQESGDKALETAIDSISDKQVLASIAAEAVEAVSGTDHDSLDTADTVTSLKSFSIDTTITEEDLFLSLYESSDSISIDGEFMRYFDNTVHSHSGDDDENVIELRNDDCGTDYFITVAEMSLLKHDATTKTWTVGGYDIQFHSIHTH